MTQIKKQNTDIILTSEQLKKLESFQSRLTDLQAELKSQADEFDGIIDRHYFNRENGFLDDQQKNLREVVVLQTRIEKMAESLTKSSKELKSFMMDIQKSIQTEFPEEAVRAAEAEAAAADAETPAEEEEKKVAELAETAGEKEAEKGPPADSSDTVKPSAEAVSLKDTSLVIRDPGQLMDEKTQGGEISIKRFIEELALREPKNRDTLYQINTQLKELLYNRKLIGYSATSMVFGRDKTLAQLIEDLQPIFLSDAVRELLVQARYVGQDELDNLRLACDKERELVYLVA